MKKIFTLLAFLTCFLGANAVEIVDVETDFSTATSWEHGWLSNADLITFEDGCIHFKSEEASANFWDYQFQVFGVPTLDSDAQYTITLKIKGTVAQDLHASFSGSGTPGTIPVTTDWQEVVLEGCQDDPAAAYFASSGQLLIQCGDYVGEWWISYVKISHEGKEQRPVTWQQWITNDGNSIIPGEATESVYVGDAEFGAWPDWALEETDGINANWRGDRAPEICAWSLTMGKNFDDQAGDITSDSPRARPYPADIEEDPDEAGNHVFAVHVTEIQPIDDNDASTDDAASIAWSNQFWIQSPQSWKAGTQVRVKFRYKAEHACTTNTQIHKMNPSIYLHYIGVGDVNFTTEWQDFEKTITFDGSQGGGWSVAFNLCADEANGRTPNVFYFDNLSWETMVLDEGLFVGASNSKTGLEYDLDNAIEFQAEDDLMVATVGTVGKQDTWVNEIMISTIRGNDASFKGATIKPSGTYVGEDNWGDYTDGSNAKIKLPAAGVWKISLDTEGKQINIVKLEGEEEQEMADIITNPTEIVINGVERDDLADNSDGTVREEEGGEGQTWDNQFFIVANRVFEGGEETVLEFDYVATVEVECPSGTHAAPGDYRKNAINNFTFKTEEQHLKVDYTIPSADWGNNPITDAQSIAFDLAVAKEANTYTIKNVKWYLKDDANENGKTPENLINATGSENFKVKVGAGNAIETYDATAIKGVVVNKNANSAAIYNLAGQRVTKAYKGVVVKDGKKYFAK